MYNHTTTERPCTPEDLNSSTDEDPVANCFEQFDQLNEAMVEVINHINRKCERYASPEEASEEDAPLQDSKTPLIGQLQSVNRSMEAHLKRLIDLRIRIV